MCSDRGSRVVAEMGRGRSGRRLFGMRWVWWLPAVVVALVLPGVLVASSAQARAAQSDAGSWSRVADMRTARFSFASVVLPDGRVLVAGGVSSGSFQVLRSAELYDRVS